MSSAATIDTLQRDAQKFVALAQQLTSENHELEVKAKKVSDQLADALDEVYALGIKIRERDEMIAELQQIQSARSTGR